MQSHADSDKFTAILKLFDVSVPVIMKRVFEKIIFIRGTLKPLKAVEEMSKRKFIKYLLNVFCLPQQLFTQTFEVS
jgi:hypothetical protein